MTFQVSNLVGAQPIANSSTDKKHALGTVVRATDPTLGEGEFIYLTGILNTVVGSVVTYDASYLTALCAVGGNTGDPVAIAMSANGASAYGWYQISGLAVGVKTSTISLAAGAAVGVLTTGKIAGGGSGKQILGAAVAVAVTGGSALTSVKLMINRPHKQGRIT